MNNKESKICKWYWGCPIKRFTDAAKLEPKWTENYCKSGNWRNCIRYQKEERGEYHPDNMLPDGSLRPELF